MNEQDFDRILKDMGQEEPDPAALAAVRERVWNNLSAGPLCAQFRSQFAGYRAGEMAEAQRMLLEDHLTRCPGCRRAFNPAEVVEMPVKTVQKRRFLAPKWAIAAAFAAVSLYFGRGYLDQMMAPAGPRATVEAANGSLYALQAATLSNGAGIADGEVIRTAAGARAQLRLADGSLVEVNERTELSVKAAWSGATIHLERGDIIVRAAKQRNGYLKVVTRDSEAAVKGTIFTVSTGTAGSLVGVVEGSVAVTQPGTERLLKPGEQATTSAALGKVSVRDAVSWSADKEKHFALLTELAAIEKELPKAAVRMSAKILPLLPPDVQIYAAMPNVGPTMGQAVQMIEQRSHDNAALKEWWSSKGAEDMRQFIETARTISAMLGDEIAFTLAKPQLPLLMAQVKTGQESALLAELQKKPLGQGSYRIQNGFLFVSDSAAHLATLTAQLGQGTQSPFAKEVAARYSRGVAWILGVDMASLHEGKKAPELSGINKVRYAFLEQRTVQGVEENEATMTFDGPRTGVASWLAAPGSSGSAEYASADAVMVVSAATRNPRQILDELAALAPEVANHMREMEEKTGINPANDIASALGTDFTLSIETAAVPLPGWFAAVEVYQPATLNATIGRLVEAYNQQAPPERKLVLAQEITDGRTWHSLTLSGFGLQWTFDRGYWIVSMDRATVVRAIATRSGGFPLIRSTTFRAQVPTLAGVHQSGFAWFNLGPAAALLQQFGSSPQLQKFLAIREPSLITFTGETERIQVASRTRLTSLMMDTMLQGNMKPKQGGKRVMKHELRSY